MPDKRSSGVSPFAGTSARDIIGHVLNRKPADLTPGDVESWISTQGLSSKDEKRVRTGASEFFKSGNDYRLTDDGNFNTITSTGEAKTSSSRTAGNRKGFNPGDLIGLGNNVSTFVGLVGKHKEKFNNRSTLGEAPVYTQTPGATAKSEKFEAPVKKDQALSAGKGNTPVRKEISLNPEEKLAATEKDFQEKRKQWDKQFGRDPEWFKGSPYAKYVNLDQVQPEKFSGAEIDKRMNAYSWKLLQSLHEKRANKVGMIQTGGSSIYEKQIPEEKLNHLMSEYEKILRSGYDVHPPHEDFITGEKRISNSDAPEWEGQFATDLAFMGLGPKALGLAKQGAAYGMTSPAAQFLSKYMLRRAPQNALQQANNLTRASTMQSRTAAQLVSDAVAPGAEAIAGGVKSGIKAVKEGVKTGAKKAVENTANSIKFPKVQTKPVTRVKADMAPTPTVKPRFTLPNNGLIPRKSFVPGTPNYVDATFKKGGKLSAGGLMGFGMEPPVRTSLYKKGDYALKSQAEHDRFYTHRAETMLNPEQQQSYNTMQSDGSDAARQAFMAQHFDFPQWNAKKFTVAPDPGYAYRSDKTGLLPGEGGNTNAMVAKKDKGGVIMKKGGKTMSASDIIGSPQFNPGNPDLKVNFSTGSGSQQGITPQTSELSTGGTQQIKTPDTANPFKSSIGGDVAGKFAKYALPFIGEGLARNELNKFKPTPYSPVDIMKGSVYDMPKPNMRLRLRTPVGPDALTEIAGNKFADAQQTENEKNFAIQNAMSRIDQRSKIVDRTNQGEMFNGQGRNMANIYGNQMLSYLSGSKAESVRQPFLAGQQHLATDIATGTFLDADRKSSSAYEIIKNRDRYAPEKVKQAEDYLMKGKKGMKFRSKFAKPA